MAEIKFSALPEFRLAMGLTLAYLGEIVLVPFAGLTLASRLAAEGWPETLRDWCGSVFLEIPETPHPRPTSTPQAHD